MIWRIKLEPRTGWGEVETIELAHFKRRVVDLTAEETSLSLDEAKQVLAELQRHVLQGAVVFDVIVRLWRRGNVIGLITKEHIADEVVGSVRMYPR